MPTLARWFVLLGIVAALPAAILLGSTVGELLRWPSRGLEQLARHEGWVIGLGVAATFLFSTAAGLRDSRAWGLLLGVIEATVLAGAGLATLVVGGALMEAFGAAPQLVLATVPLSLAAILFGARLLFALWRESDFAVPVSRQDMRALATLAGVVVAAAIGHALAAGLAS